jgi:hypothetical protein
MSGPEKRIEFSRLVDWVEGRLSEEEARAVEEQVAFADNATLADVAWLHKFARATEDSALESPPAEVRNTLVSRFEAYTEGRRTPGLLKRVAAALAFDGGLRPAVGVRAASVQGVRRQLIYSADGVDVALNFWQRGRDVNLDLEGQVFPRGEVEFESFIVQLLRGETEFAITATDDLGSFTFESIPPGVYTVMISSDQIEISITPVELSA